MFTPKQHKLSNGTLVTIREATLGDLDGIFTIYDYEVLNSIATFDCIPKTSEQRIDWFHLDDHKYPIFVATVAQNNSDSTHNNQVGSEMIIGWSRFYSYSPRRAYDRTAEIAVYVHNEWRGAGLGKILIQLLLDQCPTLEIKVILAKISYDNQESIKLHEKFGFKVFGILERCGEKFGKILDVAFMSLNLD